MPTDSGGIPVVAVSKGTSTFITSAYTILMILIFMIGWNVIIAFILAFWPTRGDPNRRTVLVALWNSGESMNATLSMASYCEKLILYMIGGNPEEVPSDLEAKGGQPHEVVAGQDSKIGSNDISPAIGNVQLVREKYNEPSEGSSASNAKCRVGDLLWGLLFVFIAFAMTVGNVIAGILVPAQLSVGNVAPVAKAAIFYPAIPAYHPANSTGSGISKLFSLFVPSALRALGSIEAPRVKVRKQVSIDVQVDSTPLQAKYNYNVSGVDMGLQSDPKLRLRVNGLCSIDDTWHLNSTDQEDTYKLFGGNKTLSVDLPELSIPPMLNFAIDERTIQGSNISYAMIIANGGLYSYTPSEDPWYLTQRSAEGDTIGYQVARGRPVLSCWENSRWHLNGQDEGTRDLHKLRGLKLHKFWIDVLKSEFDAPRVATVGILAGQLALKSTSSFVFPFYVLDAGTSTIKGDLERLVLAAWVSSRNVLRDTTIYDRGGMQNLAEGPKGLVEADPQLVLQSGDVVTLSLRILISVPSILLFLFITQRILSLVLRHSELGKNKPILPGREKNAVALLATQLYLRLDQKITSRNWRHTDSRIPFVYPSRIEGPTVTTDPDEKLGGANTKKQANADDK